jgi:hypothetical protein
MTSNVRQLCTSTRAARTTAEVGLLCEFGRDESRARHGADGLEHAGVRDADGTGRGLQTFRVKDGTSAARACEQVPGVRDRR